jgi:hypothetical protein
MKHCCNHKTEALAVLRERQQGVLQLVLAINAVMCSWRKVRRVLWHTQRPS